MSADCALKRLCNVAAETIVHLTLTHLLRASTDAFSSLAELRIQTEWEHAMTPETEMDYFFARNCYTESQRKRVKAWPPYQIAMQKNDIVQAQEFATQVVERGLGSCSSGAHSPRYSAGEFKK